MAVFKHSIIPFSVLIDDDGGGGVRVFGILHVLYIVHVQVWAC